MELVAVSKASVLEQSLARVPVTPNQQGTQELRDEVLSSVGSQEMDTIGYEVSADLDDVEFYWEIDQPAVDAVFRPRIDTRFHQQHLMTWRWEVQQKDSKNSILLDEEEDNENSRPPTTPVCERPTQPPAFPRSCPFGTRIEIVPDYVFRFFFISFYRVCVSK